MPVIPLTPNEFVKNELVNLLNFNELYELEGHILPAKKRFWQGNFNSEHKFFIRKMHDYRIELAFHHLPQRSGYEVAL